MERKKEKKKKIILSCGCEGEIEMVNQLKLLFIFVYSYTFMFADKVGRKGDFNNEKKIHKCLFGAARRQQKKYIHKNYILFLFRIITYVHSN